MKNIRTLTLCGSIMALAVSADANVTVSSTAVGVATAFPTVSISTVNGSLSFSDILASPAGATIAGGQAQGPFGSGFGWGEVFNWAGSPNGNVLSAISIIGNGSGGAGIYQPFLFDIGTGLFNTGASTFNPSTLTDLLGTVTLQPSAIAQQTFLEFDFSGSDAVTLTAGHSYAFGLLNLNASDLNFLRNSGTQSDPNGAPFQIASGGLSGTSATVPGFGAGPRNLFIGLYTTSVPEPASMALLGLGALIGAFTLRRHR